MRLHRLLLITSLLAPAVAGAQGWAPVPSGTSEVLADVHFTSESSGFAVADGGLLLTTTDGGSSWTSRVLNAGLDNQGIAFSPSGAVGVIITDDGGVLRSTDGGVNWTFVPTGMSDGRAAIAWGTESVVWVAGREGNAAVSTDAGATWTFRPSGSIDRTEGLAAAGALEAWVVGRGGEIRHTSDGGVTWAPQASGTTDDLKDIQMLDASTGYVVGSDNTILKTTNGGATWTSVASSGVSGNGLFFLSATTGWLVADAGQIWFTNDAGASWSIQPSGTTQSFNRVHFPSTVRGFAVGDAGAVVRFTAVPTAAEGGTESSAMSLSVGPNPFTAAAAARLTLDGTRVVRVDVIDGAGRRVATLHEGVLGAGTHTIALAAVRLPAGSYILRAATAGASVVRRFTVLR